MQKILLILLALMLSTPAIALERKLPDSKSEVVLSYAPLVKKAAPAVVNIYTKKKVQVRAGISPFLNDPLFQHFFGNAFPGGITTERVESSLGSGVIVRPDGLIVTNYHVIAGSEDAQVVLSDRREFEAKVLLRDQRTDLALLKIDSGKEAMPYLELMDSDNLEVGDIVIAIGNPFGVGQTVTSGIVSALARSTSGASDYQFFIQTDAAINPGNSGGALIDMEGKLAGLNSAIFTKSGGMTGIGFAIPSNMVATVVKSNGKEVVRPWLGLTVQPVTQEIANSIGLDRPVGAIIAAMHPKSPAARAGLKVGDIIVGVDGHEIADEHALYFRVATYRIDSDAVFYVFREGKRVPLTVTMVPPLEEPKRDLRVLKGPHILSGATVGNISPALADELDLNIIGDGVIITRMEPGNAARAGFQEKDVVRELNGVAITSSRQLEKLLGEKVAGWNVKIQRGNRLMNVMWNVR